jgi:hypothetical protein
LHSFGSGQQHVGSPTQPAAAKAVTAFPHSASTAIKGNNQRGTTGGLPQIRA